MAAADLGAHPDPASDAALQPAAGMLSLRDSSTDNGRAVVNKKGKLLGALGSATGKGGKALPPLRHVP